MSEVHVGQRVRQARESLGWSQKTLAKRTDGVLSQPTISRMEEEATPSNMAHLLAVTWALGMELNDLTGPHPLEDRAEWSVRSEDEINISKQKQQLLTLLKLRLYLDEMQH